MKIIVTHNSPDWDAITSVWFLKKYLPGWKDAEIKFVPAGTRLESRKKNVIPVAEDNQGNPIELSNSNEIIHVDTGLRLLDHHQTSDMNICATSLVFEYVRNQNRELRQDSKKTITKLEALEKIVKYVVALDHFQEVYWPDAAADYHEFGFFGILEGYKVQYPNQDLLYVKFGLTLLDAMLHRMEEVIWANREIKQIGVAFNTRFGKGLAMQTINDDTIKLAQKMGYVVVVRKDPRKGYVRIKCLPKRASVFQKTQNTQTASESEAQSFRSSDSLNFRHSDKLSFPSFPKNDIDLTLIKEQLAKMDPKATWFLHVSKKMLLNGTPKNPKMVPSILTLRQIIDVVERI